MIICSAKSRLQRDQHRGFTLVELLVVIGIITLIASMTLFTLQGVQQDAKERRARAQITKIHELIIQQWESYRTRAVPVKASTTGMNPRSVAGLRLSALRELMRMELPDRKTDLLFPVNELPTTVGDKPRFLKSRPSRWRVYVRRARQQIIGKHGLDPADAASRDAWKNDLMWTPLHQQAECLYLILASIRDGDTTGLDFFTEDEIGDADNDGMPEILDPWGVPIYFLRWAPGFRSDLQVGDTFFDTNDPSNSTGDSNAGTGNGDPFDPLKVDPRWTDGIGNDDPFLMYPVIFSAGRDKLFDVLIDFSVRSTLQPLNYDSPDPGYNPPSPYVNLRNDPYIVCSHPVFGIVQIGYQADINGDGELNYSDNITNHFVEVR